MTDHLIRLQGITKTYGRGVNAFNALKGVDMAIDRGDFVAVMGASGSGKSTMMNILGCLDQPTSGKFLLEGVEVQALSREDRAYVRRRYIGFVFQGFNLLPRMSALENVELPLVYRGQNSAERRTHALRALEKVGLTPWARHNPNELSGGQQQRVAIARAIVTEPQLLLADEPTGNLDSERSIEIIQLLQNLNSELGVTIVMITHEPDMAEHARRTIRLKDGRVEASGALV